MTATDPTLPNRFDLTASEIEARLDWARRGGHPRYVWDDLHMSEWGAGVQAVEAATAQVLAGAGRRHPVTLEPSGPATQRAIAVAAFTTGLGPMFGHWVEGGVVEASEGIAETVAAHVAHARARAARTSTILNGLAGDLVARDLEAVVLKGVHTGRTVFPEPGCRPTSDIDVLVTPERRADMEALLVARGFRLSARQRRPTRSVWRPPGDTHGIRSLDLTHVDNPLTLDLHLSLDRDFYGASRVRIPHPRTEDLEPIPGLAAPYRGLRGPFLVPTLALHASEDLYNLQLLRLVELCLVLRASEDPGALWEAILSRARAWRGLGDLFPALALAERLAPGSVPGPVLEAVRGGTPRALARLVDGLTPATAQRLDGISLRDRLAGAPTLGAKLRRIVHMVRPDSTSGSWRKLARLYVTRAYQLLGGRVRIGSSSKDEGTGPP